MAWPLSQDYNEAIQNPASSFADPELRAGEPATNAMGMPIPRSGNFADVYEFNCPATNNKWALKCFTREMPGLRERYAEISKSLGQLRLPFMVEFQYLEQGIRVRGRWFPLLKMRWVEGYLLNELLRAAADKPTTLDALLQVWVRMGQRLRKAGIAHGDLQHGNILMVPGTTANSMAVKLIDYDGMFVPALAQLKSGEVGHPAYQHPLRLRDGLYTPDVDRFPLLVIYCAIRALKVGGRALWERYDNGDNLLFREQDLRSPRDSALFKDLIKLNDPEVKMLVDQLSRAVYKPLDQVPLLDELVPPKDPASVSLSAKTAPAPAAAQTTAAPLASFAPAPDVTVSVRRKLGKLVPAGIAAAVLLGTVLTAVWLFAGKGGNKTNKPPEGVQEDWNSLGVVEIPDKGGPKKSPADKGGTGRKTPPQKAPSAPEPVKKSEPKDNPPPQGGPLAGQIMQNSIGMKLAYIPAGQFGMGSRDKDRERFEKEINNKQTPEGPQHLVKISKGFYMGTCEVTQWQYVTVMGKNPSGNQESPDHPVEKVKWSEAMKFCKKLSERPDEMKVGRTYRLPTEAEWEYACRGNTTTSFNVGDVLLPAQANFNPSGKGGGKTTKVGSYPPNLWGLHDMHGNVYEWCLDGPRVYTAEAAKDPRGPEEDDGAHVLRGGSCYMSALACRSAARKSRDGNYRAEQAGFRVLFEP